FRSVRAWPDETGPSLAALAITSDPTGLRQINPVRLVLVDAADGAVTQLAVIDDGIGDLTRRLAEAQSRGEKVPVAMVVGGDPAWRIAAATPLGSALEGSGLDGYQWLAVVVGAAVEVVKCRTQSLEVPAEADLIMEGAVDPATCRTITVADLAGPYYRQSVAAPLLTVETITQRSGC